MLALSQYRILGMNLLFLDTGGVLMLLLILLLQLGDASFWASLSVCSSDKYFIHSFCNGKFHVKFISLFLPSFIMLLEKEARYLGYLTTQ